MESNKLFILIIVASSLLGFFLGIYNNKIIYPKETGTEKGTGFFIKLFHDNGPLFCLMTYEHIITNEIIEKNKTIEIYYDNQKKRIKIKLNKNERFIKNFSELNIDCTIVEILPNDNISEDYFFITKYRLFK